MIYKIYLKFKAVWTAVTTVIYSLVVIPPLIAIAPLSKTGRVSFYFGKLWSWLIIKTNRVKLQVEGMENLIKDKSYVFISNHSSNLDPPIVALSVKHVVRFVAKKSLLKVPLFGTGSKLAKMIYIDRTDMHGAVDTLNKNIKDLKNGISACFFAEGTRSFDGRLKEFKKGGVALALKAGLPIVPVTIVDSHKLFPKKSLAIKPGRLRVIIDKPIEILHYTEADRDELTKKVRDVIEQNLIKFSSAYKLLPPPPEVS